MYYYPSSALQCRFEIKRSDFIVDISHCQNVADAKAFISDIKRQHPKANHHCSAYIAGAPTDNHVLGCSDDGEPSGTAGKPMLAVLTGQPLGEIVVVVTRYFGGVKLGTGGLVRAYAGCVQHALQQLSTAQRLPYWSGQFVSEYALQSRIEQQLQLHQVRTDHIEYQQQLAWLVSVPPSQWQALATALIDLSSGQVQLLRYPQDD